VSAIDTLYTELRRHGAERVWRDEPLASYTSFRIGGPADIVLEAASVDALCQAVRLTNECGVPYMVLGGCTNVLVADAGVRGLVILARGQRFGMTDEGLLAVEAGTRLGEVARWSVEQGWEGLEWAVGIPGTVGGAVVGNAGAYGGCMADNVRWLEVLNAQGQRERLAVDALAYGYRSSALKRELRNGHQTIVLTAGLQVKPGDGQALRERAAVITAQREARTPQGCCAGSVFKRTLQYPAGFLIEQAGLKGRRIGGAEISPKHANFIMNIGDATAADVRALIELVQAQVWAKFAQRLETEVEFVGDWG
jgi:UDP-N-acetylmuramate dehydrogenase